MLQLILYVVLGLYAEVLIGYAGAALLPYSAYYTLLGSIYLLLSMLYFKIFGSGTSLGNVTELWMTVLSIASAITAGIFFLLAADPLMYYQLYPYVWGMDLSFSNLFFAAEYSVVGWVIAEYYFSKNSSN